MQHKDISALTALALATTLALAACGGGGGGGPAPGSNGSTSNSSSSSPASAPAATTGNVSTPQYVAASAQLAMFNQINDYRQQCGFPALTENTILDQAAQAHSAYLGLNNLVSDTEDAMKAGYVGATYADRAAHYSFPVNNYTGGESAGGIYTNATLTADQYGTKLVNAWISGVYHLSIVSWPITEVGVGEYQTNANGFPVAWGSVSFANLQPMTSAGPLTFPCQGVSGVPYADAAGEIPTPPNTSGTWGTPVTVTGNYGDTIRLQSGTMTDSSGHVITLQLLDSSNDPNKLLAAFEGVAYSATALNPNSTYSVSLTGTYNGSAFSRSFSFTTGSVAG